ncbi:MAG: hypothetical protein IT374_16170 [Polyangiaceae bacterium]|nr:hypothetical protein [Polyangiaceae bacterium]
MGTRRLALAPWALLCLACGAGAPTPHQMAETSRGAMPRCDAGDVEACRVACESGGSNKSCRRACDAGHGAACGALASRLEREQDADDAEAPVARIAPEEPEVVTALFVRACEGGHGPSCLQAGGRILNGVGRAHRPSSAAVDMLKRGCERLDHADSCCAMAELNQRLAESRQPNFITDFRAEAAGFRALARAKGGECPDAPAP